MSAESKMRTAGIAVGTALATAAAWLGIRSHEDHQEEERARLQAAYIAGQAGNRQHIDEQHAEVMRVIQELGQSNPEGKFSHRFRKAGSAVETATADPARQPDIEV